MNEEKAKEELHKIHQNLTKKGLQQSLSEYIKEHCDRILQLNVGKWDDSIAEDYIIKLKTASVDIETELGTV